jgi:hypothetical protein
MSYRVDLVLLKVLPVAKTGMPERTGHTFRSCTFQRAFPLLGCRTTPANWASGVCPVWGDVVTFPDFVENFGLSDCASATDPSCVRGGIISLSDDPSSSAPYFQAQASAVQFPSDSVFSFDSDGDISFAQAVVTQVNSWNDRGPEHRDFQCADNWNVDGTGNKDFYSPCFSDVVDLSNVSFWSCTLRFLAPL